MIGYRRTAALTVCMIIWALHTLGCHSVPQEPKRQWIGQTIESFGSVAGKWAGVMVRTPRSLEEDWVRVSIGGDGQYGFSSYRTIGVFSGRGQFTLTEGKLMVTTERGTATGSLWVSDGKRMLRILGVMKDGTEYTAELEPAK